MQLHDQSTFSGHTGAAPKEQQDSLDGWELYGI